MYRFNIAASGIRAATGASEAQKAQERLQAIAKEKAEQGHEHDAETDEEKELKGKLLKLSGHMYECTMLFFL